MRGSVFTVDTLTVDSRVAFRLRDESSSGGEAYARDKTPQQDFALKMQGGLCVRGGAYVRDTTVLAVLTLQKSEKRVRSITQRCLHHG